MKRLAGFFFGLLLVLAGCTMAGERALMRAGLDSINIRNRNDQPFTAQDVEPYVRFFDDHGTPNDQLLAHYLLGLFRHQLVLEKQSVKYAWLANDTLAALMNYEQESFAYSSLGMPDSAIFVIEDVASKYRQYLTPCLSLCDLNSLHYFFYLNL